jgi:hypothetical protein
VLKVRVACVIGLVFAGLLAGCSFDDSVERCSDERPCPSGTCYNGFCIGTGDNSMMSPQMGSDAGNKPTRPDAGPTGPGNMNPDSGGRGGENPPKDAGPDPVTPLPDSGAAGGGECTTEDQEKPCIVDKPNSAETCNRGVQTCIDGAWTACAVQPVPEPEVCNNLDDDCNGEPDDLVESCYLDGQPGCTRAADGTWSCTGTCGYGTRSCRDGQLTECQGASGPEDEACTAEGMVARDEDCDGNTDEADCDCRSGSTLPCYNGRAGTMDIGKCKAGTQLCTDGKLGACEGEVHGDAETCANMGVDDDCNGTADDVPTVGNRCVVTGAQGPCATGALRCMGSAGPACVSNAMPGEEVCNGMDDDCNGVSDEGFNLRRDRLNCGACGNRCGTGQDCCASRCIDTSGDTNHCGACGNRCANGQRCRNGMCMAPDMPVAGMPMAGSPPVSGMTGSSGAGAGGVGGNAGGPAPGCSPACAMGETCCDGVCVDLQSDKNNCRSCGNVCPFVDSGCCLGECVDLLDNATCGSCTNDCGGLLTQDGGLTCTCKKESETVIRCSGPVLDLCILG